MFCEQCGTQIQDTAKFCIKCGALTGLVTAEQTPPGLPTPTENSSEQSQRKEAVFTQSPPSFKSPNTSNYTSIGGLFKSRPLFILIYLFFAIPTYILPYFGSNSSLMNGLGVAMGAGALPQFWYHLLALYILVIIGWLRGACTGRSWIAIFPFLAGVFDMTPGLNWFFLIPTAFHVTTLIMGVKGEVVPDSNAKSERQRLIISGIGLVFLVILAVVKTQSFFQNAEQGPSWERPNAQQLPDEQQIKRDMIGQTMGTWKFSSLAEFQELKINNKSQQGDKAEYDVDMLLGDTKNQKHYSAKATIIYRKVGGAWKIVSISKKSFERYQS